MALIKCVECSKQISDIAEICPSCGCDIKLYKEKREKKYEANADADYQERKKKMVECISCKKKFNVYVSDKSNSSPLDELYQRNPNHPASKLRQRRNLIKNSKISCTNVFLGEYTCIECQEETPKVSIWGSIKKAGNDIKKSWNEGLEKGKKGFKK